jgi:hypothetical protein
MADPPPRNERLLLSALGGGAASEVESWGCLSCARTRKMQTDNRWKRRSGENLIIMAPSRRGHASLARVADHHLSLSSLSLSLLPFGMLPLKS